MQNATTDPLVKDAEGMIQEYDYSGVILYKYHSNPSAIISRVKCSVGTSIAGGGGRHLIGGREPGPGFVGSPVVVLGVGHLHVLVEAQDPSLHQLGHSGPDAQLPQGRPSHTG